MAYIGWGVYVMNSGGLGSGQAEGGLEHRGSPRWQGHLAVVAAYPSGFQPYRNSHFNVEEWVGAGYDEAFIKNYLDSEANSYNHPNAAIEPRIPGIFQYYSIAEEEAREGICR